MIQRHKQNSIVRLIVCELLIEVFNTQINQQMSKIQISSNNPTQKTLHKINHFVFLIQKKMANTFSKSNQYWDLVNLIAQTQKNRTINLRYNCSNKQVSAAIKYGSSLLLFSQLAFLAQQICQQCSLAIERQGFYTDSKMKSDLNLLKAEINEYRGDLLAAQRYYNQSIKCYSRNHEAYLKFAMMHITSDHQELAEEIIIKYNQNNPDSRHLLACELIVKTMKQLPVQQLLCEASKNIQKGIIIPFYYLGKGLSQYFAGLYQQSLESLQRELLINQNHVYTLHLTATVCINLHKYKPAFKYTCKVIAQLNNQQTIVTRLYYIYGLVSLGKYQKAAQLIKPIDRCIYQHWNSSFSSWFFIILPIYCKLGFTQKIIQLCHKKDKQKYQQNNPAFRGEVSQIQLKIVLIIKYLEMGNGIQAEKIFHQIYQPVCKRDYSIGLQQQFQQVYFLIHYCQQNNMLNQSVKLIGKAKDIINQIKKKRIEAAKRLEQQLKNHQHYDIQMMFANF